MADESPQKRDPGAPIPPDEIDPELVALRKTGAGVGPVLSVSILVFCAYMMFILRDDLAFSRQSEQPRQVDDAAALLDSDLEDAFVAVHAVPDRAFFANVSMGEAASGGRRISPVLGSADKVWLFVESNAWVADIQYNEQYRGRLRRIADLPFAERLGAFVRSQPPAPRFVEADAVRAAIADTSPTVADPAGSPLPVGAGTPVTVAIEVPGRAELVARVTADRRDEKAWNLALESAGVLPTGGRPRQSTELAFWYEVAAPTGLDPIRQRLVERHLFSVDVVPVVETETTTWDQLRASDGALTVAGRAVPWQQVSRITVSVPRTLPGDAVVVLTDEQPAAYWYLLPIYISLVLFALLFGWALVRSVRSPKPVPAG